MPVLKYLPGTTGDREAQLFWSPTGCLRALRQGKAATTAADEGAINVWTDDTGALRGNVCRYMRVMETTIFANKKQIAAWLRVWLPKIRGEG